MDFLNYLAVLGIILQIIGFILILTFWTKDPLQSDVDRWKKWEYFFKHNEFSIDDDFNYWRNEYDMSEPNPVHVWMVPKKFADWWAKNKQMGFFSVIIGLLLTIPTLL